VKRKRKRPPQFCRLLTQSLRFGQVVCTPEQVVDVLESMKRQGLRLIWMLATVEHTAAFGHVPSRSEPTRELYFERVEEVAGKPSKRKCRRCGFVACACLGSGDKA